jgi:hypothetical protein
MTLQTKFTFTLPKGYIDELGNVHREGTMRLATALDEIEPLNDPRVRNNEAYLILVLLSRVITRLGTLTRVTPPMVERFFAADLAFLQDFYRRLNEVDAPRVRVTCPNCGHEFVTELPLLGE